MTRFDCLQQRLTPLRTALLDHPIYREMDSLDALQVFMEHHVFAVWDFMSLLKALQRRLCCVEIPWVPAADPLPSRFVNEIVLAEESDADGQGGFLSHFELYHRAMARCGASTAAIDRFLGALRQGKSVGSSLASTEMAECVRCFVRQTFAVIDEGNLCAMTSAFTFGREDLLPAVFQEIVQELNVGTSGGLEEFQYYLHRHIGLDGEEHGPMASRLIVSLCGSDETHWQVAEEAAVKALVARRELWDGIYALMRRRKEPGVHLRKNAVGAGPGAWDRPGEAACEMIVELP